MAPRKPAATLAPATSLRRSTRLARAAVEGISKPSAKPKPKPQRFDCTTCGRNLAASSFPKHLATDTCKHVINTCKQCTKTWIATQIDNTTYDKSSCPECPELMQNADVKLHAAKDIYQRFDELERHGIAEKTPGWRWCLNPKCRAGQVHEPLLEAATLEKKASTKVKTDKTSKKKASPNDICTCTECGAEACVSCDRPYHSGETCAQYQKRKKRQTEDEENATRAAIEKDCKQCPNCKKNIEKNGGCDHISCKYLLPPSAYE